MKAMISIVMMVATASTLLLASRCLSDEKDDSHVDIQLKAYRFTKQIVEGKESVVLEYRIFFKGDGACLVQMPSEGFSYGVVFETPDFEAVIEAWSAPEKSRVDQDEAQPNSPAQPSPDSKAMYSSSRVGGSTLQHNRYVLIEYAPKDQDDYLSANVLNMSAPICDLEHFGKILDHGCDLNFDVLIQMASIPMKAPLESASDFKGRFARRKVEAHINLESIKQACSPDLLKLFSKDPE